MSLLPRMLPSRRKWLETLSSAGPQSRISGRGSRAGFDCHALGWTEYVDTASRDFRERITDAGRAALQEKEAGENPSATNPERTDAAVDEQRGKRG